MIGCPLLKETELMFQFLTIRTGIPEEEVEEKKVDSNFSHGMQKCPWETIS